MRSGSFWIGTQRTGRGLKVPLSAFKALKDRYGCTVNDAVLAVVSEALHRWFKARGERVPEKVRVFCPVSVRGGLPLLQQLGHSLRIAIP